MTHLIEDIRRFGPAILYSTEVFECWNAVFRLCSILSNRQAPSHDISVALADMERFKHQVSGGWWKSNTGAQVQASDGIRAFFTSNHSLQRRLGWANEAMLQPGKAIVTAVLTQLTNDYRDYEARSCKEALFRNMADACCGICPACAIGI